MTASAGCDAWKNGLQGGGKGRPVSCVCQKPVGACCTKALERGVPSVPLTRARQNHHTNTVGR
eukprot:103252-Chlamydomonas_euryale.AAC.2